MKKHPLNNILLILLFCLTLGMAPFVPQPHIWGKMMWIIGGAHGMRLIDWGDALIHGIPWLLLIRMLLIKTFKRIKTFLLIFA